MHALSDEPLRLPAAVPAATPAPFPVLSAVVPVVGAVALWMITGSPTALWFAALGPMLAVTGLLDGRRGARRERRRAERRRTQTLDDLHRAVADRHDQERGLLWARHPDVAALVKSPDQIWRDAPGRAEHIVIGRGPVASAISITGDAEDDRSRALRGVARQIERAPVIVPIAAGIAIIGPPVWVAAYVRALLLQICLTVPPDAARLIAAPDGLAASLPHAHSSSQRTLGVVSAAHGATGLPDIALVVAEEAAPPGCAVVVTLIAAGRARVDMGDVSLDVDIECITRSHADEIARSLDDRAKRWWRSTDRHPPSLFELLPDAAATAGGLPAVIGTREGTPALVDLVADGPHAVVVGMTGAGKSELLTTWVAALAFRHTPAELSFLLVDFKGGRTFDRLATLPHVTGVMTDLDEEAAVRAIGSLRAEVLHRERVLADAGARDIDDAAGTLGRLVVVVDEYAALVAAHPSLHELFGDIAARGRALGLHLILASQRVAGVFRDAVLVNAPLRLALRVGDSSDSRATLGVDDAAFLSGRAEERGVCLVRGLADTAPRLLRIARCDDAVIEQIVSRGDAPSRRPWCEPLPPCIDLDAAVSGVFGAPGPRGGGEVVWAIADEPERQRQRPHALPGDSPGLAVFGAAGSGKTGILRAVATQVATAVVIAAEPEQGWDALTAAEDASPGTVVIADDLDLLLARLGHEHAGVARERLERLARAARSRGIRLIISGQRPGGPLARIVDSLPSRLLLAHASRADFVAAGGDAAHFAHFPPGRGRCDGVLVQGVWTPPVSPASSGVRDPDPAPRWMPGRHPVAVVASSNSRTRAVRDRWMAAGIRVVPVEDPSAAPAPGGVVWGTPDAWLANWRMLQRARDQMHLVVDTACAAEYRAITACTELPPYAVAAAGRAWVHAPDASVRRVSW